MPAPRTRPSKAHQGTACRGLDRLGADGRPAPGNVASIIANIWLLGGAVESIFKSSWGVPERIQGGHRAHCMLRAWARLPGRTWHFATAGLKLLAKRLAPRLFTPKPFSLTPGSAGVEESPSCGVARVPNQWAGAREMRPSPQQMLAWALGSQCLEDAVSGSKINPKTGGAETQHWARCEDTEINQDLSTLKTLPVLYTDL